MEDKQAQLATEALSFNNMLTPQIITMVYYLLLIVTVVTSLGLMFSERVLAGIAVLVGGGLASRIFCETLIVTFKINEALQEIRYYFRSRFDNSMRP